MNSEYRIRPMSESDLDAVYTIEKANFPDPWCMQAFTECLRYNDNYVLCLTDTREIIGYFIGLGVMDEYHIYNVSIKPNYQRSGIGLYFLKSIISSHKNKYEAYFLECRKSNVSAFSFYSKFGFKLIYERKNYYSNPTEDALVMKLEMAKHGMRLFHSPP